MFSTPMLLRGVVVAGIVSLGLACSRSGADSQSASSDQAALAGSAAPRKKAVLAPTTPPSGIVPSDGASAAAMADDKQPPPAPPAPQKAPAGSSGATFEGKTVTLVGIALTAPEGWVWEPVEPTPMGPVAVFKLPRAEGEPEDGSVRITHFPAMKGKDDMNIDRWLKMVRQADGKPHTRETAKLTVTEQGPIKTTVIDMSGTVDNSMSGGGAASPGTRMIAAIIDHPKGPHYVRVTGTLKTVEKWQTQVDAFLKSVKAGS